VPAFGFAPTPASSAGSNQLQIRLAPGQDRATFRARKSSRSIEVLISGNVGGLALIFPVAGATGSIPPQVAEIVPDPGFQSRGS